MVSRSFRASLWVPGRCPLDAALVGCLNSGGGETMTSPLPPGRKPRRAGPGLPPPPKGWPIGSYPTYAEAQRAVDYLSDHEFPVQQVTIVGVDPLQGERGAGRR